MADEVEGMRDRGGIAELYVEIDAGGRVTRELGLSEDGTIVHRCPSDRFRQGRYGLLDNVRFVQPRVTGREITREKFEVAWERVDG